MGKSTDSELARARTQIKALQEQVDTQKTINETLFKVSEAVHKSKNPDDLYASIYSLLNEVIYLPNFYIAIYDKTRERIVFPFFRDELDDIDFLDLNEIGADQSLTGSVIFGKKSRLYTKEMLKRKEQEHGIIGPTPAIWAGVPLMIDNEAIGAMVVQHYTHSRYFSLKDLRLMEAVSGQIAMAIERKRQNDRIIQRDIRIKKLSEQTEALSSVAASILSEKNENRLFKKISTAIVENSDYNSLIVSYFKDVPPYRDIIAWEGYQKHAIDRMKTLNRSADDFNEMFRIGEQLGERSYFISHEVSQKTHLRLSAAYSDTYVISDDENAWHPKDFLFVKLLDEHNKLIGVISVDNPKSGKIPTAETIKPLEIFANLISQIIIVTKLQNELKAHKENLEELVAERTEALTAEIAERIKIEAELSKAQSYIRNIVDSMPSMLIGVDVESKITHWNKAAERCTGINAHEACGNPLTKILPYMKPRMDKIIESIRTKKVVSEEKKPHQSDDELIFEDVSIYPLISNGTEGAVIRIDDVTERIRLEEMIIQSEKMLSIGGLAAGVAHEINNPLSGIIQSAIVVGNRLENLELPANLKTAEALGIEMDLIREFMEKREILSLIRAITESGRRMADIVSNMLSFARKSGTRFSSHNLAELMDKSLDLAATDFDLKKRYDFKALEIHKDYDDTLPFLLCDSGKIQQVFLNILRNGAQAMQDAGTINPAFYITTRFNKKSKEACIEIRDNGPGMDNKTCSRIFEPFFSTKPVGIGTGLGLSVSYFIITENHGGRLTVESSPGCGAKFIICLPIEKQPLKI